MVITRNGIQFELTKEELRNAYYEYKYFLHRSDVEDALLQHCDKNAQKLDIDNVLRHFEDNLDKNEMYAEDYFFSLDSAIEQSLKELRGEKL